MSLRTVLCFLVLVCGQIRDATTVAAEHTMGFTESRVGEAGWRLAQVQVQDPPDQRDVPDYLTPKQAPDALLRMPERPSRDMSFLQGCWITDPFQHEPGKPRGTSTYCFNSSGKGSLRYESAAYTCQLAAVAEFRGNQLRLVDSDGQCSQGVAWAADHLDCERGENNVASCSGWSQHGATTHRWTVNLHYRQ